MKKIAFSLGLLTLSFTIAAKPLLVDKIPFCDAKPYVFYDMDGDGRKEIICTNPVGKKYNGTYAKFKDFYTHDVVIDFGQNRFFDFSGKLLTSDGRIAFENDQYIEAVNLNGYKHRLLKKKLSGMGIRLVNPEKSTVIYYWDKKKKSVQEFWESD